MDAKMTNVLNDNVFSCTSLESAGVTWPSSPCRPWAPSSGQWGRRGGTGAGAWLLRCKVCTKPGDRSRALRASQEGPFCPARSLRSSPRWLSWSQMPPSPPNWAATGKAWPWHAWKSASQPHCAGRTAFPAWAARAEKWNGFSLTEFDSRLASEGSDLKP